MGFSVLQTNLGLPSVDDLKHAFRSVKCLTDYDTYSLGADGFGILVKNLSGQDASNLQGALRTRGIETEIIDDARLPTLPPSKSVHRIDCAPDGLQIYDPLERSFKVDWAQIMLVAAGQVSLTEFNRVEKRFPVPSHTSKCQSYTAIESEYRIRKDRKDSCILEIILAPCVIRFSLHAEKLNYSRLGARKSSDVTANFRSLVCDLCGYANTATVNRGAYYFKEGDKIGFNYPSKNAFLEEMIWLIWQRNQSLSNAS